MKNNKKGFTLIELLAVIVILAIIALIATPIVLNMIKNARRSAAKSSILGYIDSVNNFIPLAEAAKDLELKDEDYKNAVIPVGVECVKENNVWKTEKCRDFYNLVDKKTKGSKPTDIKITIENHQVKEGAEFTTNKFQFSYQKNDVTCGDEEVSSNTPSTPQKVWTAVTGDGTNVGDEIAVGDEHFYVISNDGTTLNALAKYNLNVGPNAVSGKEGIQNADAKGYVYGESYPYPGAVVFSDSGSWTAGENGIEAKAKGILHDALESYKSVVKGASKVRLITKSEIEALINDVVTSTRVSIKAKADAKGYSWLYSTSYWSGSANSDYSTYVWNVESDGTLGYRGHGFNQFYGVRPVITLES